jgi:hypothetical protein
MRGFKMMMLSGSVMRGCREMRFGRRMRCVCGRRHD